MKSKDVRVVRVRKRRWRVLAVVGLTAVGVGALYLAFQAGLSHHGRIKDETARLGEQVLVLETRSAQLEENLVDAEVAAKVDRATVDELRVSLAQMHDERALLREEVTFYRSLMAPTSLERGLQISEFALVEAERGGDAGSRYRYELLLTQVEARRGVAQGRVTVDLVGEERGEQVVLPLTDLEPQTDYPLKYRFRYFQDFSGVLELPERFEPLRVVVTVTRQGSREANLQRTFDWLVEEG